MDESSQNHHQPKSSTSPTKIFISRSSTPNRKSSASSRPSSPPSRESPFSPTPSSKTPAMTTAHQRGRRLSLDILSTWKPHSSSSSTSSSITSSPSPSLFFSTVGHKRTAMPPMFFLGSSQPGFKESLRRSSQGDISLISTSGDGAGNEDQLLAASLRASRRRASQADIMLRASQVDLLMQKSEKKNSMSMLRVKHSKGSNNNNNNNNKASDERKECFVLADMEDEGTVVLTCRDEQHLKSILTAALMDRRVHSYRLVVASTRAVFKVDQGISRRVRSCEDLLDSSRLPGVEDLERENEAGDARLHLTREIMEQERLHCDNLQSLFECYAEPLRKYSSLSKEDHQIMFMRLEPMFSISASLLTKLESVIETWDSDSSRIGNLFSTKFWNYYQEYLSGYPSAKRLLTEKYKTDAAFEEFCELRQQQGRLSLDALLALPVKKVRDFDKHLTELLEVTDPSHHDYEDLCRAAKRVHSMVIDGEEELYETDHQVTMDDIQGRFPQDDLHLTRHDHHHHHHNNNIDSTDSSHSNNNNNYNNDNDDDNSSEGNGNDNNNKSKTTENGNDRGKSDVSENLDKTGSKAKGLSLRRRSAPSAVLFKSVSGNRSKSTNSLWSNAAMGKRDSDSVINSQALRVDADSSRMFLMEGSVKVATAMQSQDRYMFLFSDLLLLAKQKSPTAFKLKHRIQLSDMWIASCIDEVCESNRPADQSFVIGWPTTNAVVTFPSREEKEKWLSTLVEGIKKEKFRDDGATMQLKVAPRDINASSNATCQMTITNETKVEDVLVQCLKQMNIPETDAADYQLWVTCGKDGTPYPLIGHETPFSIKRSQLREATRSKSRDDIDTMTSGDHLSPRPDEGGTSKERCEFFIKQKKAQKKTSIDDPNKKSKFKSPNFLTKFTNKFIKPKSLVFKLPLSECFTEGNDPPEAIVKLMVHVYNFGPKFNGIMRRGNNQTLGKEIREKIESGVIPVVEELHTPTAASVFKDFLRCIPGGLLTAKLSSQLMNFHTDDPYDVKISKIKDILSQLPPQNHRMLTLTICLLQQIAKHSDINQMNPNNLATCIAPSFWPESKQAPNSKLTADALKEVLSSVDTIRNIVTPLITFMIVYHIEIFGEDILKAFVPFGCAASPMTSCLDDNAREEQQTSDNSGMISNSVEDEGDEEMFEEDEIRLRHHTKMHPTTRQSNSGTDSDSTHSVLSMPDNGVVMRRDDSSIDSLVDRDYYPADSSPTVVKSHLSPSNLSRDSGLTLSDTQLYEEDGDITITPGKTYQRSASHDDDLESQDMGIFDQRGSEPVPPPRTSRSRKPRGGYRSEANYDQHGYSLAGGLHKPSPFLHSASTTALDFLPHQYTKSASGNLNPSISHPPLSKRISSDSIGEEDESEHKTSDFQRIRKVMDMGTIVKSDSGTHLFVREETQPSKYNLESGQRMTGKERFMRQSSVTDSTPPVSPQSRYSLSSRDSILSDSTFSMSQESPGHSAPHTPDSLNDKPLSWSSSQTKSSKAFDPRLTQSLNLTYSRNLSKSTPNIAKEFVDDEEENSDEEDVPHGHFVTNSESSSIHSHYGDYWSPSSSKPWSSQSHEAEEVEPRRRRLGFSLMIPPDEVDFSFGVKSNSLPTTDKHQSLLKGSPPPNVLLKSLQAPSRRESVPEKVSEKTISPHYRRSSADTVTHSADASKGLSILKTDEYSTVTSKPIMIASPNSQDNQSSSTRAKLSKYVVASVDLRPDKPPCYEKTLQRQFMLKQNVPVDIDMDDKQRQKENSNNARAMYEKSLKIYNEQRKSEVETRQSVKTSESNASNSDYVVMDRSKSNSVISPGVNSNLYSMDMSHSGGASKNLFGSPDAYDDSGASGFIDLGSISNNSQEDIVRRRNAHAGSGQNSGYKSQNVGSPVSISRTDSKLSDTGSSSGSSATLSTLSRHSDSFGRRSDISNATVSSVTSSDSNSETNSVMSRRKSGSGLDLHNMPYSRHFRAVEHEDEDSDQDDEFEDEEYVMLRKDPQKIYQESIRMYEQGNSHSPPLYSATLASTQPSSSSSSSSSSYSLTPRSNIDHTIESKPSNQHMVPKTAPQKPGTNGSSNNKPSVQLVRQDSYSKQLHSSIPASNVEVPEQNRPEPQRKFSLTEMQSDEHHNNFLKVRSLFYNPEDDHNNVPTSPHSSPHFTASPTTTQPPSIPTQNIPKNSPKVNPTQQELPPTTNNSKSVNSPVPSPPSSTTENKELPWNVQKLKRLFDKSEDCSITTDRSIGSIQLDSSSTISSTSRRRSPPPYQNPPSFRRSQDTSRASTSSNSSTGSEKVHSKSSPGYRLGPQASSRDSFNSSYSSSEESYNSLDRRSRKSSLQDSESLSDHTNITYV